MRAARERALAKLTLELRVTGIRADGYHLLESEMVTVDLADELDFRSGGGLEVVDVSGGPASVPEGRANLVSRAMQVAGKSASVRLRKVIPVGAGLGGGSADAAAVLRWAGVRDLGLAASIGSDVPFCLSGGHALVSGAGEVVRPLEFEERRFLLMLAPVVVGTASVYGAWDAEEGLRARAPGSNDLERAAVSVEPRLALWRDKLWELSGCRPHLAGSGSTWFVEGTPEEVGLEPNATVELDGESGRLLAVRTARP